MDPSTNINQDPLAASNGGATSFAPDFDMSAINEAVAAGGETPNIQNTFDANDINLDNTPTTDKDLEQQLADNPNMNLANSIDSSVPSGATTEAPKATLAASFVGGDLEDAPAEPKPAEAPEEKTTVADLANSLSSEPAEEAPSATEELSVSQDDALIGASSEGADGRPVAMDDQARPDETTTQNDFMAPPAPAPETTSPTAAPETTAPVAAGVAAPKKSNVPMIILIALAMVAVAAVVVAVILLMGK
jgi:hypothetical protein